MAKRNNIKQPQPQPETETEALAATVEQGQEAANETTNEAAEKPVELVGAFTAESQARQRDIAGKIASLQVVRQRLAYAADMFAAGQDKRTEGQEAADDAAARLFLLQATGSINSAETSATLGDIFGYVPKKDGTPGKTPKGDGGHIRKRVVRLVSAYEYASGQPVDYFDGVDRSDVSAIVNGVANGQSIWTAYDSLGKLVSDAKDKVDTAFNPKRVMDIAAKLASAEAIERMADSKALRVAYATLRDVLNEMDGPLAAFMAEREANEKADANG